MTTGRDGALIGYPELGTVVTLHERTPQHEQLEEKLRRAGIEAASRVIRDPGDKQVPPGSVHWVEVYDLSIRGGTPLPPDFFDGPRDKHYELRSDGTIDVRGE